jgi:hypothetical protein
MPSMSNPASGDYTSCYVAPLGRSKRAFLTAFPRLISAHSILQLLGNLRQFQFVKSLKVSL